MDIDSRWDYWKSLFKQTVDTHIPMRKARVRAKTLPWIGSDVRALMRARNYYCTKAKKSNNVDDWNLYRKLRNRITREVKRAEIQYFEKLSEQSSGNPRKMWKELNRVLGRGSRQKIEALTTPSGRVTELQTIVEELSNHFSSWSGIPGVDRVGADQGGLPPPPHRL